MRGAALLLSLLLWAQEPANQPVPYTLADRDRLIRVEERLTSLEKEVEGIQAQLARMESRNDTQFYTLLTILVGFIAFLLWDRRKALAPMEAKVAELQKDGDKLSRLVQSLREYARTHPDLAEILRRYELV
ncbi:MAG: hypothetical protein N3E49_09255 [Bacteroidia bacterium]|nr:hypothetical protein [Bacteroidia bacterium]